MRRSEKQFIRRLELWRKILLTVLMIITTIAAEGARIEACVKMLVSLFKN